MADTKVDSTHETYFEWWLNEAQKAGFVKSWYRQTEPNVICAAAKIPFIKIVEQKKETKRTKAERTLFRESKYTEDYVIVWPKENLLNVDIYNQTSERNINTKDYFFLSQDINDERVTHVDVKPDRIGMQISSSSYSFKINQKLMWLLHNIHVQKVVLFPASNSDSDNTLFQRTWTPVKYKKQEVYKRDCPWGKKGTSKLRYNARTIRQFLNYLSK